MYQDAEIIAGLRSAEEWAIEAVIDQYGNRLLQTLASVVNDFHTAEELVQETLIKMCQSIHDFRGDASLYTWIYRIGLNLGRNHLRKKKLALVGLNTNLDRNESQEPQPHHQALREETTSMVYEALDSLPLKYREVLILHYLEEMQLKDIAKILNEPLGTVKSKLSRGRVKLKNLLSADKEAWQHG